MRLASVLIWWTLRRDTEHYIITWNFLNGYPAMLRVLMTDDEAGELE